METDLIVGYKKRGQTPLALINDLKEKIPALDHTPIGYAGRLDPMAEGLVLLLLNDKNKNRSKFEKIKKVYQAEILFGVETDTYDALGLVSTANNVEIVEEKLKRQLTSLKGKHDHPYPPFSSPLVNGKPLWQWAKDGRISEVQIPTKTIEIYEATLIKLVTRASDEVNSIITDKISEVTGDFRQHEILNSWREYFKKHNHDVQIAVVSFDVSSGTYIRSLAHNLGKLNNTGAIALSIKRTQLGSVRENQAERFCFVTEQDLLTEG